ncbi:extracellular ligand-binding receptor [Novosphingobium sp. Rr 2-17]|uniref:ABC transporter substrate-binding protein n=1 Tax=Novosphingobium sp. Rr 2-17 TaxID=555793 RepID=UPI00026984F3|nr:ABC transporter substrate-binding protein [Novosphingobium sp. Rr 2-17]EIZ79995.1 extracellular ligand-binding receptor [Novosphingobium sp. Rr 2-17]
MPASVKVGVLNDMADLSDVGDGDAADDIAGWLEREVAAVRQAGRLAADVEFVHAYALGFPSGTAEAVEHAYRQLVDAGCVLIVGPALGDNALVAAPIAEQLRMPTINWANAERARGRWMFHHQVGSHEDEAIVIARHLHGLGCRRIGVIHDASPAGTRQFKYLADEAQILGMEIAAVESVSPMADDADAAVAKVLETAPDGFVHLGLGLAATAVAAALAQASWHGPRMMNIAGLRGGYREDFARSCDGWFYVDMHSDGNRTLQALLSGLGGAPRQTLAAARGHDLGRLVAEGLARAPDLTREGLRTGLEHVKWLPAAQGHEGTLLGFGVHDRGALHGRYLVVRQWLNGKTREIAST